MRDFPFQEVSMRSGEMTGQLKARITIKNIRNINDNFQIALRLR